jgi:ABC-type glucose/galactose transport system permease subunit
MLPSHIDDILAVGRAWIAGEIVDNRLNPVHLAIATTGYRIQSHLRIPDRIGFFSSGPQRLQVPQATSFIALVIATCVLAVLNGLFVLFLSIHPFPNTNLGKVRVICASMTVSQAIFMWALTCLDKRRAPGYEWADWKVRTY